MIVVHTGKPLSTLSLTQQKGFSMLESI